MRLIRQRKPSPAMVVACAALVIAIVGTAIAAPVAVRSVLDRSEKKQVKKIAKNQVNSLAPGLSVAGAKTADNATNATNANELGGVALADVAVFEEVDDADCQPATDSFSVNCTAATVTINEPSDVLITAEATWHSDDAEGGDVQGDCRIERGTSVISGTYEFGSSADQTVGGSFQQALYMSEGDTPPPGSTYDYALSCSAVTGDFDLTHEGIRVIVLAQ